MHTTHLALIPCTVAHLEKLLEGGTAFEDSFGYKIIAGYNEFPGAVEFSLEQLRNGVVPAEWWSHLFIHMADRALIGIGGYTGAPDDSGQVEIGYSIAPAYRGHGYATEAAYRLTVRAFAHEAVRTVIAHTLAEPNPSTRVLAKCGFRQVAEIDDPNDGRIWRWSVTREAYTGF